MFAPYNWQNVQPRGEQTMGIGKVDARRQLSEEEIAKIRRAYEVIDQLPHDGGACNFLNLGNNNQIRQAQRMVVIDEGYSSSSQGSSATSIEEGSKGQGQSPQPK